jgi:predicted acyl esterase
VASKSPGKDKTLKGVFYDSPVQGLEYETQTISGITNENGEFQYYHGETATFSIGGLVLGAARGKSMVTPADLVIEVSGDVKRIRNQKVTSMARFLQSFARDGNVENGIVITDKVRSAVREYRYKISFDQPEEAFTADANVKALLDGLNLTLPTASQARNHLRQSMYGIRKMTDVRIPTRDGAYLLADVFLPIGEGKYPVVMGLGAYGKAFGGGCICSEEDARQTERAEDDYFDRGFATKSRRMSQGMPVMEIPVVSENFEVVNSLDWVPHGYVVIRVENRGVGKNPGLFEQFSRHEAEDYYDAIEWAGTQAWSNGNVGLLGASYYAMNAYNVAGLQPPHLKAMIPIDGDIDSYRDYNWTGGGLFNTFNNVVRNACGEWQGVDWLEAIVKNPFIDPEIYGPEGKYVITPDINKITVPFWSEASTDVQIHLRGSSEAYILAASKHKKFRLLSEPGVHEQMYSKPYVDDYRAFFDYWLKGIKNGIMDRPPVELMIRTGRGGHYWLEENEWPIARTQYTKFYLDALPSAWAGDGKRKNLLQLHTSPLAKETKTTYSAEVKLGERPKTPFAPLVGGDPPWSYGVSFVTEPLTEDIVIAGYLKLVLWVASTSNDMQIQASVRVMDENNVQVPYVVGNPTQGRFYPVGQGGLKVSHRKLDPKKSTIYRPYHTHLKEDYQPLKPGEIVEAQVELWPTTALIRKGHRIVLDVQPATGEGLSQVVDPIDSSYRVVDNSYQVGASNTIYTGPDHPSYLQLPVIPPKKK